MYGFCISKNGILTDNYYKFKGIYEEPEPFGVYIMIRKEKNSIKINQDYYSNFGLFIYENKEKNYFALSNSFLLLQEYLVGKKKFTLNRDYADQYVYSILHTYSIHETLVKEIIRLPSNTFIIINIRERKIKTYYSNIPENTISFGSLESLKIIDNWADKWGYILRSLKKKTDNISFDLTGGFDTRMLFSILLNSGIDLKKLRVHSLVDNFTGHKQDLKIASIISSRYGLKVNKFPFNKTINRTIWNYKDSLSCLFYSKFGFHKSYSLNNQFDNEPSFIFTGGGGEFLRCYPCTPIQTFIEKIISENKQFISKEKKFYNSSIRLLKRTLNLMKKEKKYDNNYRITTELWRKAVNSLHFGRSSLISFLKNQYSIQILMDPYLKQLHLDIPVDSDDILAYIYIRFAPDLIYFPFEKNRKINIESMKKAKRLNKLMPPYKVKYDYNMNFYIDNQRKSPAPPSKKNDDENYLSKLFKSKKFINLINKVYGKKIYDWAYHFNNKKNSYPLKHLFGLYSIYKTIENIKINKKNY